MFSYIDDTPWEHNDLLSREFDEAFEAVTPPSNVLSVRDGVPMQINIQTQEIMDMNIKVLNLKEVTNQSMFEGEISLQ